MYSLPLILGSLQFDHGLIQGPLAGYSCAPFRELFSLYTNPAYCVSEMLSAHDVLYKHALSGRYLYRSPYEGKLCYQIAGNDPGMMAEAAVKLVDIGADLIDINCGCPKPKIRKNKAGSALLEDPNQLVAIVKAIRKVIKVPLTVKIRLLGNDQANIELSQKIAAEGVDGLIVHGRQWTDTYDCPSDLKKIANIRQKLAIPVIANGDIADSASLNKALMQTGCAGFMMARATTGRPWLFQELLQGRPVSVDIAKIIQLFLTHLQELSLLENEYKAILQSRSLVRYYFRERLDSTFLQEFYQLSTLTEIENLFKK